MAAEKDANRKAKFYGSPKNLAYRAQEQESGRSLERGRAQKSRNKVRGEARNAEARNDLKWDDHVAGMDFVWNAKIVVPFSQRLSKNAIWSYGAKGHVFIRKEVRAARDSIALAVRQATQFKPVRYGKLWMGLYVQKPSFKGDAINVIDSIADAVKTVIPIDDNLYSLMFVDWDVVYVNPKITIYLGQKITEDRGLCSYCGQMALATEMTKATRICRYCSGGLKSP